MNPNEQEMYYRLNEAKKNEERLHRQRLMDGNRLSAASELLEWSCLRRDKEREMARLQAELIRINQEYDKSLAEAIRVWSQPVQ